VTERLFVLICAATFWSCAGGAEHEPAADGNATGQAPAANRAPSPTAARAGPSGETDGLLDVTTAAGVASFFGTMQGVVTDARGNVVAGAEEDVEHPELEHDRRLAFVLPAGSDYHLSLSATSTGAAPAQCHASAFPLRIEAGATASAQIFAWQCGDVTGYVPRSVPADCYWLADWAFVSRTRADVGETIAVSATAHDPQAAAQFNWSSSAGQGSFADPRAAQTSFRCQAAGENLALSVAISDGNCEQQLTQLVSCL
jgi:hypothetical protein